MSLWLLDNAETDTRIICLESNSCFLIERLGVLSQLGKTRKGERCVELILRFCSARLKSPES